MKKLFPIAQIAIIVCSILLTNSSTHAQGIDSCRIVCDSLNIIEETEPITLRTYLSKKEIIGLAIPAAFVSYGVISIESKALRKLDRSIRKKIIDTKSVWKNSWDDYLQYAPIATAYGLKLAGIQSKHNYSEMLILGAMSGALEFGIIYGTKILVGRERPNGKNRISFPSGHTATAFMAAEFLHQEYKDQSPWISVAGYSMASIIGVSRIFRNKHWLSDVVAGAGIGILSTKFVYWAYPKVQKLFSKRGFERKAFHASIGPSFQQGAYGFSLAYTF